MDMSARTRISFGPIYSRAKDMKIYVLATSSLSQPNSLQRPYRDSLSKPGFTTHGLQLPGLLPFLTMFSYHFPSDFFTNLPARHLPSPPSVLNTSLGFLPPPPTQDDLTSLLDFTSKRTTVHRTKDNINTSHRPVSCPEKPSDAANTHTDNGVAPMQRTESLTARRSPLRESREHIMPHNRPFQQRYDRHGRPFGERISAAAPHPTGPRNKLAPPAQPAIQTAANEISAPPNEQREHAYYSPPYSRRRLHQNGGEHQQEDRDNRRNSPRLQWKAKSTLADQEATSQRRSSHSPRPSLGRNLDKTDFPPLNEGIANATTVGATNSRSSHPQWRTKPSVPDHEATAQRSQKGASRQHSEQVLDAAPFSLTTSPSNGGVNPVRRRGRPARSGASRTHVRLSPKVYAVKYVYVALN
ncbi:hypothetical protein YC2023_075551 [Brassica napus]